MSEGDFFFLPFPCRLGKVKKKLTMFFIIHEKKKPSNCTKYKIAQVQWWLLFRCVMCAFFSLSIFWLAVFFFHSLFSVCSHFSFAVFCFSRFLVGVVGLVHYMVAAHDDGLHFITIKMTKKARERDGVREKERNNTVEVTSLSKISNF